MELCEDVYAEILCWVEDYDTIAAYLRKHKWPRLVMPMRISDGPSAGLAVFRGQKVVFWESSDRETVDPRDYPLTVWEKVLNHTGDIWADVYDREFSISFDGCGLDDAWPLEWHVRTKRWFKLYVRHDGADAHTGEAWLSISTNENWAQEWKCVGEVTEDEMRRN